MSAVAPPRGCCLDPRTWSHRWRWWAASAAGERDLQDALAEHRSFSAAEAVKVVRFSDQIDPQSGLRVTDVSEYTHGVESPQLVSKSTFRVQGEDGVSHCFCQS